MIAKIIEYSARNKFLVFLLVGFLTLWGWVSLKDTPLDAIPDLSDTQVIIFTEWIGRSPNLVEDQITYPISSTLLAAPKVQTVRGFSFFGSSFIYVIFEEGTDIYWARSRVLEYLQAVKGKIPAEVNPVLGPDATSVGWGFSYAVVDETNQYDLSQLRSVQDYTVKLALESVPGVSQVASVGGFVKQYQVTVDPNRLLAYGIPITKVMEAVKKSNADVAGRILEFSGVEYMLRGRGYITSIEDLKDIPVGSSGGTSVYLRDVANVQLGPQIRRGIVELDGKGEVAGGIVVVRFGENVLNVIDRVKQKIKAEVEPSLPPGMKIVVTYDRSDLIHRSIDTLKEEIIKLSVAVSVVCIIFLFHLPSALVVILTLPVAIIMSFIMMYQLQVTSNIMSLSGIAIAIGAMVDASIIMVENAHKKLEEWYCDRRKQEECTRFDVIIDAAKEVGPALFFSLLVITVGFLPVFTLQAQAGRLFKPLAYTKTFAMLFSSFLAITLTPVLMTLFIRGKIRPEERNPLSVILRKIYEPVATVALRFKWTVIAVAVLILAATVWPFVKLGSEFMPPLNEGSFLYMPVTVPGASVSEVSKLLQLQDKLLMTIPEVAQVFGKAGRAETPTDPAPLEMFETVVNLKPESEWRPGMDVEKLKNEINEVLQIPGTANTILQPIETRIMMLATGLRGQVGVKVLGPKLEELERIGIAVENAMRGVKGTRSVYAERVTTGYFLDFDIRREEAARYGLAVDDIQRVIQSALGGMTLTTTIEGRERYSVNVRYARELRDSIEKLKRVLVSVMMADSPMGGVSSRGNEVLGLPDLSLGSMQSSFSPTSAMSLPSSAAMGGNSQALQVPLGQLADIRIVRGPMAIKSEEGLVTAYVYVDFSGRDVGGYVKEAREKVAAAVQLPPGYRLQWSGEYEYLLKTQERLKIVIPVTVLIIFVLIFFNTKSIAETLIILSALPFSLVGSFWLLYLLDYNMSIAVWVGIIALAGLAAETGVVMLLYLDLAYEQWKKDGRLRTVADLKDAVMYGAVKRLRPKIMTVSVILAGLVPILFSHGAGADVMKRIAAAMVGGVITSTVLTLILYPVIYVLWKERGMKKRQ